MYLNAPPLDELIARAGLTHAEFAEECGVSAVTLSRARNGRPLRTSTLRRLAIGLTRLQKRGNLLPAEFVTADPTKAPRRG